MSKTFDTVNRGSFLKLLEKLRERNEIHLPSILKSISQIKVKVSRIFGKLFKNVIKTMQGERSA